MPTVEELLDEAEEAIRKSKAVDLWRPSDARVNGEELLGYVIGKTIDSDLLDYIVPGPQARRFKTLVRRRVMGEPVAMIIGKTEFKGLELIVRRGVFVPRNSSEFLAAEAIRRMRSRNAPVAVDVATGTGPVALAVANEVRKAKVYGIDISAKPLAVARENAVRLKLRNVQFLKSDMLEAIPQQLRGKIDVFTIHPPYVARDEVADLPKEIRAFEPKESLTDRSDDGLGLVRVLAAQAPGWLRPGGWMMVEVSSNLARAVRGILQRNRLVDVKSRKDSLGVTRVISGRTRLRR